MAKRIRAKTPEPEIETLTEEELELLTRPVLVTGPEGTVSELPPADEPSPLGEPAPPEALAALQDMAASLEREEYLEGASPYVARNPCACGLCTRIVQHWYCSECGVGPKDFRREPPVARREHRGPDGSRYAVYCCGKNCLSGYDLRQQPAQAATLRRWRGAGASASARGGTRDDGGVDRQRVVAVQQGQPISVTVQNGTLK